MKKLLLASVLAIASFPGHSHAADIYTGRSFMQNCSGNNLGFCYGFALGISMQVSCVPKGRDGVTADQLAVIAVREIGMHPEKWHVYAGTLVVDALKSAYGC